MRSQTLVVQALLVGTAALLSGTSSADTVRSNQRNDDAQAVTTSSHAQGAPAKVVPPQSNQQINPVVVISPQGVGQPSTNPSVATTRKKQQ